MKNSSFTVRAICIQYLQVLASRLICEAFCRPGFPHLREGTVVRLTHRVIEKTKGDNMRKAYSEGPAKNK